MNPNKWISVDDCYPPSGKEIEVLIEGKTVKCRFEDTELYRSWTINKDEYDGVYLPTHWRFLENEIGVVMKVDIENETAVEL